MRIVIIIICSIFLILSIAFSNWYGTLSWVITCIYAAREAIRYDIQNYFPEDGE